ncbi:DsbA family protein [Catenulispora rubra]|uniref:DsbA family protein n=1 Tax=Catenulispora rubra TaxID=280293 RepID=UPI001892518A|nr:thioredoxin domain-containing protein [Catenulispora rubra]
MSWETGLREVMTGTAGAARVAAPPTDTILRKGRSSLRWRNGLTGSGVLGVVAVAVLVGTSSGAGSVGGSTQPAVAADAVVTMGPASAKTKVVLYEDYRCPTCKELNTGLDSALQQDAAAGKIQIEYRPTDLIDRNDAARGTGSVAAGNAVLCAAERGDFYAYRDAVYAHQSVGATDFSQSPAQLIDVARTVPGLDTPAFEKCVDDQPYAAGIKHNLDTAINTVRCPGVPCIDAAGKQWSGSVVQGQDLGAAVNIWLSQIIASA